MWEETGGRGLKGRIRIQAWWGHLAMCQCVCVAVEHQQEQLGMHVDVHVVTVFSRSSLIFNINR